MMKESIPKNAGGVSFAGSSAGVEQPLQLQAERNVKLYTSTLSTLCEPESVALRIVV